ncbi:uncharacterized protein LOC124887717 [Capsicum annuum]|uniref:uncharacterized protein LOC124887717 n=1 Tax=Capsicum annuum TaxID=4072 RepID=UPI001FB18334|nr:uncharacterized protein LOC124887717 [Capsicum annuum]
MRVTNRSGKVLASPLIGKTVVDIVPFDIEEVEIDHPVESEKLDEIIYDTPSNYQQVDELEKRKRKEVEVVVTTLLKSPSLFPHQLKKKANDAKFRKFMAMLKKLTINFPLVQALEQMSEIGFGEPTPTNIRLVMADRSVKRPVEILYDVLVKVASVTFPVDFVILNCEEDFEVPIILGRSFLRIGSVLIDLRTHELLFRLNDEVV